MPPLYFIVFTVLIQHAVRVLGATGDPQAGRAPTRVHPAAPLPPGREQDQVQQG